MALTFPKNPVLNQVYDYAPFRYQWDGTAWLTVGRGADTISESIKAHENGTNVHSIASITGLEAELNDAKKYAYTQVMVEAPAGVVNGYHYPIVVSGAYAPGGGSTANMSRELTITTGPRTGDHPMNNCSFHGTVLAGGWTDLGTWVEGNFWSYSSNERSIHSIWTPNSGSGNVGIYVEARAFPVSLRVPVGAVVTCTGAAITVNGVTYNAGTPGGTGISKQLDFGGGSGYYSPTIYGNDSWLQSYKRNTLQNSQSAHIFHEGTLAADQRLTMRSFRNTSSASWWWESVTDNKFGWGAGVNNGSAQAVYMLSNGSLYASSFPTTSDARLKFDNKPIENALSKIALLEGQTYTKKAGDSTKVEAGLIAQDVQKVLPESVTEGSEGMLSVEYAGVTALLVEAIKELSEKVDRLEAELSSLKKDPT